MSQHPLSPDQEEDMELPSVKSYTRIELNEGLKKRKQMEEASRTKAYTPLDFSGSNMHTDKDQMDELFGINSDGGTNEDRITRKKDMFYIRYPKLLWSYFLFSLMQIVFLLKFLNDKCGNFFIQKGRMDEKWTFMEALPYFLRRKKKNIIIGTSLIVLMIFSYQIFKMISKEIWHEEYIDSWKNVIIDPLRFVDFNDENNPFQKPDVTIFDDHYDKDLVSWISNQNIKGERKITTEEIESGKIKIKVFGLGEEEHTISFELLKKDLIYYSDRFDGCVSGKNLGIPVDLVYLNMNPESTRARFMLQPEIVSQGSYESNVTYTIQVRNTQGYTMHVTHNEVVPNEIKVEWLALNHDGKVKKISEKFSKEEALCIWYQIK